MDSASLSASDFGNKRIWSWLLATQATLTLCALSILHFAPRSGQPVALLPLTANAERRITDTLSRDALRIVRSLPGQNTYVVLDDKLPVADLLLKHGIVAVSVNTGFCSAGVET